MNTGVRNQSIFLDGRYAALRAGVWENYNGLPQNPHRPGTHDFADWHEGFGSVVQEQLAAISDGVSEAC